MEVILKEDVVTLGKAGDVVKVKEGYARNFLLPRGKAVVADTGNMKAVEQHKQSIAAKQAKLKKEAEALAEKLKALSITLARDAGEQDKLFGSVTSSDIAEALRHEGVVLDKRAIHLEEPIKQIGVFDVTVRLHTEVTGVLKVWIVKK